MKAFLERHTTLIQWLSGLGIPVAIIFAGWLISNRIESAKLDSEYVRMALALLKKEGPKDDGADAELSAEQIALRMWAVRLLNRKSPEKFTEAEQRAILDTDEPFGDYIGPTYDYYGGGSTKYYSDGTLETVPGTSKMEKHPGRWVKKPSPSPAPAQSPK